MTRRLTCVAVLLVMGLSACGSSDDDAAIPQGTTTSPVRSTTTTSAKATDNADTITARYEAFWDARFKANEEPVNPDDPALREYATGAQLENVVKETTRNRDAGIAFREPATSVAERRVRVISVEGDTAHLQDCATTDGVVYRVVSGDVVDDKVVTHSIDVHMRRVDGDWKVESANLLQAWDGVQGCAAAS